MSAPTFARTIWKKRPPVHLGQIHSTRMPCKQCHHYTGFLSKNIATASRTTAATRLHSYFASTVASPLETLNNASHRWTASPGQTLHKIQRSSGHSQYISKEAHDLKQRLSTLRVSKATQQDFDTIWRLLHHPNVHCSSQLVQFKPSLITMIYRLVAAKGTVTMMNTLYNNLLKLGIPASLRDIEWVILSNVKVNQVEEAHKLLCDIYRANDTPSVTIYNQLLKLYAKDGNIAERRYQVETLLKDMARRNVVPNTQTYYQLLMSDAIHGTTKDTSAWFEQLIHLERANGFTRTERKVKRLIQTMAERGHPAILSVLKRAAAESLTFDISIWNAAVKGCARAGNVTAATEIFNYMSHNDSVPTPTLYTHHTLIRAYLCEFQRISPTAFNIKAAISIFETLLARGIIANQEVYGSFIRGYLRNDVNIQDDIRSDTLLKLWRAIMFLENNEQAIADNIVIPLVQYYRSRDELSTAEQIYWDLRSRKQPFSRELVNVMSNLIGDLADKEYTISAMTMVYDLLAASYQPSSSSLCSIIHACADRCDIESARQLFDIMKEHDPTFTVTDLCLSTIVCEYARLGNMREASTMYTKLLDQTKNKGLKKQASNAMIKGYVNEGNIPLAETIWYQQDNQTATGLNAMVEGYARLGDWAKAKALMTHPATNPTTHKIWILAKLEQGQTDEAQAHLKSALQTCKPCSLVGAIQAVMDACSLKLLVDDCEAWFRVLKSAKAASPKAHQSLLSCYQRAGLFSEEERVQQVTARFDGALAAQN